MKDPWKTEQSFNNLFYIIDGWWKEQMNIILSNMMFILGLIIMIKCTTLHINRCQEKIIWSLPEDKICSFQLSKGIHAFTEFQNWNNVPITASNYCWIAWILWEFCWPNVPLWMTRVFSQFIGSKCTYPNYLDATDL